MAVRITNTIGTSSISRLVCVLARMMVCETKRVQYKASKAFGVQDGRDTMMAVHATAQDAVGSILVIWKTGWKTANNCNKSPRTEMTSNLIVCDVKKRSGLEMTSPSNSIDSLTMFLVHCGNLNLQGANFKNEAATIEMATNAGIAEIYGSAHFSKRACVTS